MANWKPLPPFQYLGGDPLGSREEGVEHLDDLLLRRVRLGMLLPNGAQELLPRIRQIAQPELGWSNVRWQKEEKEYISIWKKYYSNTPG